MSKFSEKFKELDKEQEAEKKSKKIFISLKDETEKKPKKPMKSKKDIEIKTDNFRTGISNITGLSKRDKPPILKQKLMDFLETHDLTKKNNTWYWEMI